MADLERENFHPNKKVSCHLLLLMHFAHHQCQSGLQMYTWLKELTEQINPMPRAESSSSFSLNKDDENIFIRFGWSDDAAAAGECLCCSCVRLLCSTTLPYGIWTWTIIIRNTISHGLGNAVEWVEWVEKRNSFISFIFRLYFELYVTLWMVLRLHEGTLFRYYVTSN